MSDRAIFVLAGFAVLVWLSASSGCDGAEEGEGATSEPEEGASESQHPHGKHAKDDRDPTDRRASSETASSEKTAPRDKLESLDQRRPVPLLPRMAHHQKQNMRDHLVAIQRVSAAAAERDFEAIREAAEPIGSSPEMRQMCRHMGAGADGFTERALEFHQKADGIIESANDENLEGVFESLSATLETCTSCHANYKQQVVSPEAWEEATGMTPPSGGGAMHD